VDPAGTTRELRAALEAARNADGGWGYARGRGSRLEPTALALLALKPVGAPVPATVLDRWPSAGALLRDPQSGEINVTHNGQAAVAAQALGMDALAARLIGGLVALKGQRLPPSDATRQDNSLQGWPWVADTFSWVEPTAWCVIALKRWARIRPTLDAAARIEEAERLLLDRSCAKGGWNYGNPVILGRALAAYVPTTALGLLALRTRAGEPAVTRALDALSARRLEERSGFALSLARIALTIYRESATDVDQALAEAWQREQYMGNVMSMALALYALAGGDRYDALAA
jgi:hypothetical protein